MIQSLSSSLLLTRTLLIVAFLDSSAGTESACNAGDLDSIPRLGRSPGEGKVTHSSILAWRIPGGLPSMGVAQSRTRLKRLSSSSSSILLSVIDYIKKQERADKSVQKNPKLCRHPQGGRALLPIS